MASKRVKQSIILSVSVMKGCYRHIQVSVNEDLETLADIILWAFDFDQREKHLNLSLILVMTGSSIAKSFVLFMRILKMRSL